MAKPSDYLGANLQLVDTFSNWIDLTNEITYDLATVIVTTGPVVQPNTTNGALTSGNAHVEGRFSANVAIATDYLRGGSVQLPNTLVLSTNTIIKPMGTSGANGTANSFIVSNNTFTQMSGDVYITTAGAGANGAATGGISYADDNLTHEFIVDYGVFKHTQGLLTVSGNTVFDQASNSGTGRVDIDVTDLDISSNTVLTNDSTYIFSGETRVGVDGADFLNVESQSVFHANVTIGDDGTDYLLVNSNTYFTSNVQIGDSATADFLTVNSNTFINNYLTVGSDTTDEMNVNAQSTFHANTIMGDDFNDVFTVNANTTFFSNTQINSSVGLFTSDAANNYFSANVNIGNTSADRLRVEADSFFSANVTFGTDANDKIHLNSQIIDHVLPDTASASTLTIGADGNRWGTVYVNDAYVTNNTETSYIFATSADRNFLGKSGTVDTATLDVSLGVANNTVNVDLITANNTSLVSRSNGTMSLGTSANEWTSLYISSGSYLDATTMSITSSNVNFTSATGLVTITNDFVVNGNTVLNNYSETDHFLVKVDTELRGNTNIGEIGTSDDEVYFNAQIASDLIPSANTTQDLGSSTNYFNNIYVDVITSPYLQLDNLNDVTGTPGTLNQVLKSDADGTYSFATVDLAYISDVDTTSVAGQFLQANTTGGFDFITAEYALDDLTDVNATSTDNQLLRRNGAGFDFVTINLDYLSDVDSTATDGQVLTANTTGGYEFQDRTLFDLVDFDPTGQANAHLIYYNADANNYQTETLAGLYANVALDDLLDVDASTATTGQFLQANTTGGFDFITAEYALDDITNVDATATAGQFLQANTTGGFDFITATYALDDLTDVDSTATTGQFLQANSTGGFEFSFVDNAQTNLDDLLDVSTTGAQAGDVLTANSSGLYEFTTLELTTSLSALDDVTISTPTTGQVLKYNGSVWVNGADDNTIGATVSISNTAPGAPNDGDLWYDNVDGLLSVYYEDGTSNQWVTVGGNGITNGTVEGSVATSIDELTDAVTYNNGVSIGIGKNALVNDDGTTNYNTAIGAFALQNTNTGTQNVALGYQAGQNVTSGFNNIVIGYNSNASTATTDNEITLGNANHAKLRVPGIGLEITPTELVADDHKVVVKTLVKTHSNISTATAINCSTGSVFTATPAVNTNYTFTNVPTGGAYSFRLILNPSNSINVNYPSSVQWTNGSEPADPISTISVYEFMTVDGGSNWYGWTLGSNMS